MFWLARVIFVHANAPLDVTCPLLWPAFVAGALNLLVVRHACLRQAWPHQDPTEGPSRSCCARWGSALPSYGAVIVGPLRVHVGHEALARGVVAPVVGAGIGHCPPHAHELISHGWHSHGLHQEATVGHRSIAQPEGPLLRMGPRG